MLGHLESCAVIGAAVTGQADFGHLAAGHGGEGIVQLCQPLVCLHNSGWGIIPVKAALKRYGWPELGPGPGKACIGDLNILCGHAPLKAVFKGNPYGPVRGEAFPGTAYCCRGYQDQHSGYQ